jgi:peptide/nickel transport system substrate-binding protein
VVAAAADPGQFNPGVTTAGGTHFVADSLYNGLLFLDEKLEPKPDLAESWTISPDGKTYTFKLRQSVKWHDGQPFSSADVKFSFEEVLLKYHARTKSGLEAVLDRIETPDANTVVMQFKQPYGPLLQRLDVVEAPIVAKHIYEGQDPTKADANLKPVGTGPFKLAEYVKGDRVRMVRNDAYFKPGLPYLDELVFRIIPQANTSVLAFESNEVDYLNSVPGPDLSRLQQNPNVMTARTGAGSGGSFCENTLIYNLSRAPLDRLEVRQALAYSIDRAQILEQVQFGQGQVAISPISSAVSWAHNPNVMKYPLDRDRANQLLDSAGLTRGPDGNRFSLEFVHATSFAKLGELMKQHLAPIGINLELKALEVNAANDQTFIAKDFGIGVASYCNGPDPEIGVKRAYVSNNIGPILFSNGAGYRNPQVDELFDRAAASVDRQARVQAYAQIQDILVRDVPYWWLVETDNVRAWRKQYHDIFFWAGSLAEAAWLEQ